jgi:hypothetical protein
MEISNLMHTPSSSTPIVKSLESQRIKVFGNLEMKVHKRDSQNCLRLQIPKGDLSYF